MQQIVNEDVPSMILYFPQSTVGVNKRVNGYKPAPGNIPWNNIQDWWVAPRICLLTSRESVATRRHRV